MEDKTEEVSNPHDRCFLTLYTDLVYCMDIFELALSPEERPLFNWKEIRLEDSALHHKKDWKNRRADIVFSVPFGDTGERFRMIFLLEHKSYRDPSTVRQVFDYQHRMYSTRNEDGSPMNKPILPILVYHGEEREWGDNPLCFHDTLKIPEDALPHFKGEILNFRFRVVNLNDSSIWKDRNLVTKPALFALSNIRNLGEKELDHLFELCKDIREKDRHDIISVVTRYAYEFDRKKYNAERLRKMFERAFEKEGGETVRKLKELSDIFLEEGFRKGRQEGRQEGREELQKEIALQMLKAGDDVDKVCLVTELPKEQVEALKKTL